MDGSECDYDFGTNINLFSKYFVYSFLLVSSLKLIQQFLNNFIWFCFIKSEILFDLSELVFILYIYCYIILLGGISIRGSYKSGGKKWGINEETTWMRGTNEERTWMGEPRKGDGDEFDWFLGSQRGVGNSVL